MNPRGRVDRVGLNVVTYHPGLRQAFVDLNMEWIKEFFSVEPTDLKYLDDPDGAIIKPGGDIVFLVENERAVATCALLNEGDGVYELAKMAVAKPERGRGLGNDLMAATIQRARDLGGHEIFLRSNTTLAPAINLYKKFGFETVDLGPQDGYDRGNIKMVLSLVNA